MNQRVCFPGEVYLPGEIQEAPDEKNGSIQRTNVIVITQDSEGKYDTFAYPILSSDFKRLTNSRTIHHPAVRVYIGVSATRAQEIVDRNEELNEGTTTLSKLDRELITIQALEYRVDGTSRRVPLKKV